MLGKGKIDKGLVTYPHYTTRLIVFKIKARRSGRNVHNVYKQRHIVT